MNDLTYSSLIPEKKKLRAAIYVRVSSKEQAEMFGPDYQLNTIMAYIQARWYDIELAGDEYIYKDTPISWITPIDERPELGRMMSDLEYGSYGERPFDVVIVYKIDRFARQLSLLLEIVDRLTAYEVGFISTQESIDTSNAFGKAMLGILWVFAELERDMILERTSGWYEEAQNAGVWMQDKYGYIRDDKTKRPVQINQKEADIIKEIFERYVYWKERIIDICKSLMEKNIPIPAVSTKARENKHKIKNPYFRRESTVRSILQDEVYIGKLYYGKTKTIKDGKNKKQVQVPKEEWILSEHRHVQIIDDETINEAQRLLENKLEYKQAKEEYLLSWLLWCDDCEEHRSRWMIKWTGIQSNGCRYYICAGKDTRKFPEHKCRVVPLWEKALNTLVIQTIKGMINRPQTIGKILANKKYSQRIKEKTDTLLNDAYTKESRILNWKENTKDMYSKGDISSSEYTERKNQHNKELKAIRETIESLKKQHIQNVEKEKYIKTLEITKTVLSSNIEDIFSDMSKAKKFLNHIVHSIIIYSRDKKDTDILEWRPSKDPQRIPYQILIKLRLPQDILKDISMGYTVAPGETITMKYNKSSGKTLNESISSPRTTLTCKDIERPISKWTLWSVFF